MGKSLKAAKTTAKGEKSGLLQKTKGFVYNTLKFGTAVGIGVVGSGVAVGVKAKHSMDRAIDSYADGLCMALISSMSTSKFEETMGLHAHQHQCTNRGQGFDWAMASAYSDNQQQYGS